MIYRTAKLALLVAFVVIGLSPVAIEAQQRETKQEGAAREKEAKQAERKAESKKEAARKEEAEKEKEAARKKEPRKEPAKKEASADKSTAERGQKERLSITPEREAAVMTFVRRNHEELAQLLAHLKENQPREYERAIRELFRTSERLTQINDRDRAQYDLEVRLWKTQSRIQLLTARLKMGESEDLRSQLKELLGEQIDNRTALLKHDREKAANRLAKIDDELSRLERDREKAIDKQLQSLTGAGKAKKPSSKPETRRTAKAAAKQDSSAGGSASDAAAGSKAAD